MVGRSCGVVTIWNDETTGLGGGGARRLVDRGGSGGCPIELVSRRDRPARRLLPEGIAVGTGHEVYAGSLADGAIWKGDLRSGAGDVLVPGTEGGIAVGMSFDDRSGNLFVADGPTGTATVYDGTTGATVAALNLAAGFINHVIVTRTAAYFTNSFAPELYVMPLDARGDVDGPVRTISLSGDFVFVPGGFNANGIEATPDGRTLIVAGSSAAELYTVDPATGVATVIDLDVAVTGDGLVLLGRTPVRQREPAQPDRRRRSVGGPLVGLRGRLPDQRRLRRTHHLGPAPLVAVRGQRQVRHSHDTDHPYEIVRVDR